LELTISDAVKVSDEYSWVFKIPFGGVQTMGNATYTGSAPPAQQTTNDAGTWLPSWLGLVPSVLLGLMFCFA
jgi:alpha-L-fucosidase